MITFLIATTGRDSIKRTLASIEHTDGDEVLVVGGGPWVAEYDSRVRFLPCAPGGDWGHTERNYGQAFAKGQYISHIDDDDVYAPGHRALMADAIAQTPNRPVLFRMQYPNGVTLWSQPVVVLGNVGTPMMLLPNQPEKFGTWGPFNGGDCHFLQTMGWQREDIVWRTDVTVLLGHN